MTEHELADFAARLGLSALTLTPSTPIAFTLDNKVRVTLELHDERQMMVSASVALPPYDRTILPKALSAASYLAAEQSLRFTPAIVKDRLCLLTALPENISGAQAVTTVLEISRLLLDLVEER